MVDAKEKNGEIAGDGPKRYFSNQLSFHFFCAKLPSFGMRAVAWLTRFVRTREPKYMGGHLHWTPKFE